MPLGILVLLGLLISGCLFTRKSDDAPPHRIMVIDDHFDQSLPIFQGRIAGTYAIMCDENSCRLEDGLQYKPVQDAGVLKLREKWNQAVKTRDFSALTPEELHFMNEGIVLSHGTATAAVIAYNNPSVQLYLVQREVHEEE